MASHLNMSIVSQATPAEYIRTRKFVSAVQPFFRIRPESATHFLYYAEFPAFCHTDCRLSVFHVDFVKVDHITATSTKHGFGLHFSDQNWGMRALFKGKKKLVQLALDYLKSLNWNIRLNK